MKLNSKRPHAGAIVSNLQPRQQPKKNPAQFPPAPSEQPIHNMAIKGKGKQKGQEQDPPPPVPPASPKGKGKGKGKGRAAAKGSDDPAPPKGKKGKDKPTEVIELSDSGDEDDDIEDADGEDSDRRPGPSTRRQSGVSSDDPMGMPPAFNLTSGAAEVASRHKSGGVKPGHVGEMKKVFEPDPPSIASSLKPKVISLLLTTRNSQDCLLTPSLPVAEEAKRRGRPRLRDARTSSPQEEGPNRVDFHLRPVAEPDPTSYALLLPRRQALPVVRGRHAPYVHPHAGLVRPPGSDPPRVHEAHREGQAINHHRVHTTRGSQPLPVAPGLRCGAHLLLSLRTSRLADARAS